MKQKTLAAVTLAAAVALGGNAGAAAPSMEGESLYGSFLPQYASAFEQMQEGHSEALAALGSEFAEPNVHPEDVACYYADLDKDGQAELLLINKPGGYIQDIYTLNKVGKARHILSGWSRNRYYLRQDGYSLYREASGGASSTTWEICKVLPAGEGLQMLERLRTSDRLLDGSKAPELSYFHQPSTWGMEMKVPKDRAETLRSYFEKTKDMPDTEGLPTLADYYRQ